MRVFGRILFALLMVGLFLLAFTYSRDLMLTKYLEDVFGSSLTDENSDYPRFYYFYTSIPDYHNNEPVISIDMNGYQIMGYEVLTVNVTNDNTLDMSEYVYLIVYSPTEDLSQVGGLYLENSSTGATEAISLQRFKTLNLINGVNDTGTVYLPKEQFFNDNYDTLVLTDKQNVTLIETAFDLNESDFIISDVIQAFYDENGYLPTADDLSGLAGNHVFPNKPHVMEGYAYIFYIAMGIYFVVLIISTYLVFFRKKKHEY